MGACATKPKEAKEEAAKAPAPEPEKEEEVLVEEELKKVDDGVEVEKEIVLDDDVNNKRRSLGNLFEKEGKVSTEGDKTPSDTVKEEDSLNQNPTEGIYETNPKECGETETPVEHTPKEVIETVEVAPTNVVSIEEAIVSPVNNETQEPEEKKMVEEKPAAAETQKSETPEENEAAEEKMVEEKPAAAETQKYETPEENEAAEEKTTTVTQKSETPEENEAVEEKTTTVTQKPETAVEEKTTVEN